MGKLSYREKVKIYQARKMGIPYATIKMKFGINTSNAQYIVKLVDKHGLSILKKEGHNNYSIEFIQKAIDEVIKNKRSVLSVSIDLGLPSESILRKWVKDYKENSYNIVKRKKGRLTVKDMINETNKKPKETDEEKIKRLEQENKYLKAEIEYSKKVDALVQERKNRQQKKK